jgi:hypothetical protein
LLSGTFTDTLAPLECAAFSASLSTFSVQIIITSLLYLEQPPRPITWADGADSLPHRHSIRRLTRSAA